MCLMRLVLGSGWPLRLSLGAFLLAWPDLRVSSSRYVLPMLLLRSHDPRKESVHQLQATDDALFVACHGRSKAPPPQIAQDLALSANCHLNLEIPHRTVHSPLHTHPLRPSPLQSQEDENSKYEAQGTIPARRSTSLLRAIKDGIYGVRGSGEVLGAKGQDQTYFIARFNPNPGICVCGCTKRYFSYSGRVSFFAEFSPSLCKQHCCCLHSVCFAASLCPLPLHIIVRDTPDRIS